MRLQSGSVGRGLPSREDARRKRSTFSLTTAVQATHSGSSSAWASPTSAPSATRASRTPKAVRDWLEKDYPAIRRLARENRAEIFWEDEAACQASETKARGYSPRGKAPVLRVPSVRDIRCNYAAAVSNRGELYFEPFEGTLNAERFRGFLEGLMEDVGKPVVLITDNLKVHHANCLKDWFGEQETVGKLWIRYLPSYSPELNPEEYINRDVKAAAAEMDIPGTAEEITARTV